MLSVALVALLADILTVLQRIAIACILPEAIDDTFGDRESVVALAGKLDVGAVR